LFYLGHPAHFHLFRGTIAAFKEKGDEVTILIKTKDVLDSLIKKTGWEYRNILPGGRAGNNLSAAFSIIRKDKNVLRIVKKNKPDIMVGTGVEIAHVGKLLKIPSVIVNEDDFDAVPLFAKLAYPFAGTILAPISCKTGKWIGKTVFYKGYHELSYLHPNHFKPDEKIKEKLAGNDEKYYLLRFAKLTAHHDSGKTGITKEIAVKLIDRLQNHGRVYITSERSLESEFESYRLTIDPNDIHHALYYADLYIGDSQTMAAEAAVLGTPSLRFNDFVGKLGYLEELEHKYGLTFGIKTTESDKLYAKVEEFLKTPNLKQEWVKRRQKMLADKIDVTAFMVWFIENYPDSVTVMKENSDFQEKFI